MCQYTGNKANNCVDVENALDKVVDMCQSAVLNLMIENLDHGKNSHHENKSV